MFRGAAVTSGRVSARSRAGVAAASLVVLLISSGCVTTVAGPEQSLARIALERDQAASALLDDDRERAASYLRQRWGPVALPEVPVVRWVTANAWGDTMSRCLEGEGLPGARAAEGGGSIDFSGVSAEGPRELYLADVAVYVCQSRYPARSWYAAQMAEIEAPWAWQYSVEILVPCLLAAGYRPPAAPPEAEFLAAWGGRDAWNAYATLSADPLLEQKARLQCPPPEVVLEGAP